jgi:choline dehydrogenase
MSDGRRIGRSGGSLPTDCDYLIVGAGSAGCVLANRLSAEPANRVVLVEAGPRDDSWLIRTPAAVGALIRHRRYNWNYATVPQPHLAGRRIPVPRGRVLGGTSSINGMVYIRGHPCDFDQWASQAGHEWDYAHVLPYFIRSESNRNLHDPRIHGLDGPMRVTSIEPHNPLVDRFLAAAHQLGFAQRTDFNGGETEGFGTRQATIRDGRRESAASAFLHPIARRQNLTVVTDCQVRRVTFDGTRATGVECGHAGGTHRIAVRLETVVCAGAIDSPALLLRSGLGDGEDLRRLGIQPVAHIPGVGHNLGDHVASMVAMRTQSTDSYGLSLRALPRGIWNVLEYLLARRGPLASNVFEAHGFIRSTPALAAPDLQIIFMPAHRNPSGFPIPLGHGYGINVALLTPRSRGSVTLESPDPHIAPRIDPAFLSAPEDLTRLMAGLKLARRILAALPFAELHSWEHLPGPAVQDDAALEAYIRRSCGTVFHPVGTCRMGSDAASVVDPSLRVRAVSGLRVIDASVFPAIVRGNTHAPVVMVAEKGADLILGLPPPAPVLPEQPAGATTASV